MFVAAVGELVLYDHLILKVLLVRDYKVDPVAVPDIQQREVIIKTIGNDHAIFE